MIKINLVKSKVGTSTGTDVNIDFNAPGDSKAQGLVKIILMAGFIVGAIFYRDSQIDALNIQYSQQNQKLTALRQELERKKQEAGTITTLEEEAKELNDKLTILRNLSKLRLIEVRSLDFIQSIIPQRVWLQDIVYNNSQFRISGFSSAEEEINKFLQGLEASPFFKEVILIQSLEKKDDKGSFRTFEVSFRTEILN